MSHNEKTEFRFCSNNRGVWVLVKFLKEVAIFFGIVWFIGTNMEEKKESGVKEQVEIILEESEERTTSHRESLPHRLWL